MAKISKEEMHQDETIVMNILEQQAKESIDEIAKKCGFSRQKVWRIIRDLEEKKKIWGYTAIIDEEAKGMKHFVLLVKRSSVPFNGAIRKELIHAKLDDYMPGIVKVENIYITHGNYDWIVTFYAP
jgi:DNA-binding Lrp family transcriptional regulator